MNKRVDFPNSCACLASERHYEITREDLRLISELDKQKTELGRVTTLEQLTDLLNTFGFVEADEKPIEVKQ